MGQQSSTENRFLDLARQVIRRIPRRVKEPAYQYLPANLRHTLRLYLHSENYLEDTGWYRSETIGHPVDRHGDPIPWYTYPAVAFIKQRLDESVRVFEYGSGYSTVWYAERAESVVAVEHSETWWNEIRSMMPENTDVRLRTGDEYISAVQDCSPDLVVIDGEQREDCINPSIEAVSERGVIIYDDYHRVADQIDEPFLDAGFRKLPFYGLSAHMKSRCCTALFYRDENCLGI